MSEWLVACSLGLRNFATVPPVPSVLASFPGRAGPVRDRCLHLTQRCAQLPAPALPFLYTDQRFPPRISHPSGEVTLQLNLPLVMAPASYLIFLSSLISGTLSFLCQDQSWILEIEGQEDKIRVC